MHFFLGAQKQNRVSLWRTCGGETSRLPVTTWHFWQQFFKPCRRSHGGMEESPSGGWCCRPSPVCVHKLLEFWWTRIRKSWTNMSRLICQITTCSCSFFCFFSFFFVRRILSNKKLRYHGTVPYFNMFIHFFKWCSVLIGSLSLSLSLIFSHKTTEKHRRRMCAVLSPSRRTRYQAAGTPKGVESPPSVLDFQITTVAP